MVIIVNNVTIRPNVVIISIIISNETFVTVILIDFWFLNFYHLKQLEPLK